MQNAESAFAFAIRAPAVDRERSSFATETLVLCGGRKRNLGGRILHLRPPRKA
jgi:hypothetical protein